MNLRTIAIPKAIALADNNASVPLANPLNKWPAKTSLTELVIGTPGTNGITLPIIIIPTDIPKLFLTANTDKTPITNEAKNSLTNFILNVVLIK